MTSPDGGTPPIFYTPTAWRDSSSGNTAINAVRLNNLEAGLSVAYQTINDHDDRLDALEAAAQSGTAGMATIVTSTTRPAPAKGLTVYDDTLHKLITGDGSAWRDQTGTVLAGAGAAAGPTGFTAVVQSDNSILCSWAALAGATSYKFNDGGLSPTGVTGATALTATTYTYRPGVLRNYDLWVTAQVGGVETAASNHATATLPFGGGGTTGTPAQILNIGTGSTQNHFNEGIGYSTGHVDKTMAQIVAGTATDSPYFTPNTAGNAVQFEVFANGGVTSPTTDHPRSELRELLADGVTKAAWTAGSGKTHVMSGTSTVTHLPADSEASSTPKPQVCFAQIHDQSGDVIRLQVENSGSSLTSGSDAVGDGNSVANLHIVAHTHSPNATSNSTPEIKTSIQSTYTVGTPIDWKIEVINTTCKIYIGGVVKFTFTISGTGFYFKAGSYIQFSTAITNSHGNPDGGYAATSYGRVELKNLVVTHTPAL